MFAPDFDEMESVSVLEYGSLERMDPDVQVGRPLRCGYGACAKCNCRQFEGNEGACANRGCGHAFEDHW